MIDSSKISPKLLLFEKLLINLDETRIEELNDYIAVEYFLTVEDEPLGSISPLR